MTGRVESPIALLIDDMGEDKIERAAPSVQC